MLKNGRKLFPLRRCRSAEIASSSAIELPWAGEMRSASNWQGALIEQKPARRTQVIRIRNVSLFLRTLNRFPSCLTSTSSPTRSVWPFGAIAVTIQSPARNFTRSLWASWGNVVSVPTLVTFALFQPPRAFPNGCSQMSYHADCDESTKP